MRKALLGILMALACVTAWHVTNLYAQGPNGYGDQKVVYHNNGGPPDNKAYFMRILTNAQNHVNVIGKDHIDLRIVDHGMGLDILMLANTDRELAERIDALKAQGVHFLVCANTLRERQIDWHTLYNVSPDDIVPSGVAELAKLQSLGFAYIHL